VPHFQLRRTEAVPLPIKAERERLQFLPKNVAAPENYWAEK